jgi:enolase
MDTIARIETLEVLDGRGDPTVKVTVITTGAVEATAIVPSGRSTGRHEAQEVRDGDPSRYGGRGVREHLDRVTPELNRVLRGQALDPVAVDLALCELDGTPDKSRLGTNVTSGVSLAVAKAAAAAEGLPLYRFLNPFARRLPVPQMNLINGGRHAYNATPVQEFIILPVGAEDFAAALSWTMRVYRELAALVEARYGRHALNTGDEGGLTPDIGAVAEGIDVLHEAVGRAGLSEGIRYGLDMASTHLYEPDAAGYRLERIYGREELFQLYAQLARHRRLISVEDPVMEDDFDGLAELTARVHCQFVGDDLFCTNPERVRRAAALGAGNALLWKFNQIGTLTEAWQAAQLAREAGYEIVVSERSGDTEDPAIADLAVALGASQIKTGAPVRGERTAKYNRLLAIARELGDRAQYAGEALRERYG